MASKVQSPIHKTSYLIWFFIIYVNLRTAPIYKCEFSCKDDNWDRTGQNSAGQKLKGKGKAMHKHGGPDQISYFQKLIEADHMVGWVYAQLLYLFYFILSFLEISVTNIAKNLLVSL